ncbi:MAG: glycosyltransferase family 39 protein [Pirellulales bacterium]|nr:glycosyltransferase family 39 protein [Pirellulales bacterium]
MKKLLNAAVMVGLAVYVAAFYLLPTPVPGEAGKPLRRFDLFWRPLLSPDTWLFPAWFGSPPQFSFLDRLPVLLTAGAIILWAVVLGWLILRLLFARKEAFSRLETFVFSLGVGLAALSAWTLLMGLCGVLDRTWTVVVPGLLTLATSVGVAVKPPPQLEPRNATDGRGFVDVLGTKWLWLAAPFAAAILLSAMLPPVDFDVREYHLQAPKEFFQQGRITFLPHNVYANMPLGAEMFALLAMVIAGDWWLGALAGKTVIAAFTPLCVLGLFAAGRKFFSTGAGAVAALVYISVPWITGLSPSGLIEGATACYLLLAVYALLLRTDTGAALAGLFAGAAVATKYPAALFVLLPLAVWVVFNSISRREAVKRLAFFLLAAAVVCGPWFAKNRAFTGNPAYPLLYGTFGGASWNEEKNNRWNDVHRPRDFSAAALGKDLGRVTMTSDWLSPLVWPLAALALIGIFPKNKPLAASQSVILMLAAYALFVIAAWWLFTHRIDRFWIPVLPIAALLAGAGACWSVDRWWRGLLRCLLIVGLTANFLLAASVGGYNAWFVPLTQLRDDPDRIGEWHRLFNTRIGDGRLLAVGDAAVFDLRRPVLYNTCFDDCVFEQAVKGRTAEEVRAELRRRNVAYVFVNWSEIARYRSPGNYGFTDFIQPEVFERLAAEGVLEPLPSIPGNPDRAYRVADRLNTELLQIRKRKSPLPPGEG